MTNYAAFLFNTLKGLADIHIAGVGDNYSFPLVFKQAG